MSKYTQSLLSNAFANKQQPLIGNRFLMSKYTQPLLSNAFANKQQPLIGNRFLMSKYTQPLLSNAFANKQVPKATSSCATIERLETLHEFYFSCQTQQYTKQLAHIEFIGRKISQYVSAHEAIIGRYNNRNLTLLIMPLIQIRILC
jgi:hypothetical protein